MPLLPPGASPPSGTATEEFLLEPLHPRHVELDYDAVMETREMLRRWSFSTWPEDDFTLRGNLEDLEEHWREHEQGTAFTYTILSADRASCLGCVYMKPLAPFFAEEHAQATGERPQHAARVVFWVRQSRIEDDLDRRVLDHLIRWFSDDWPLERVAFYTAETEGRQRRIFEGAGLHHTYMKDGRNGRYAVYL